jgi:hypothetical protein
MLSEVFVCCGSFRNAGKIETLFRLQDKVESSEIVLEMRGKLKLFFGYRIKSKVQKQF